MNIYDEYEFESNGNTFYVEIEGQKLKGDDIELNSVKIYDALGNLIDEDNNIYEKVREDAINREYELEIHSRTFNYYEWNLDHLYKGE